MVCRCFFLLEHWKVCLVWLNRDVHATRLLKCTYSVCLRFVFETQTRVTHDVMTCVFTSATIQVLKAELSVSRTLVWCTANVAREIGTLLESCLYCTWISGATAPKVLKNRKDG